jgi:hypothetical protein
MRQEVRGLRNYLASAEVHYSDPFRTGVNAAGGIYRLGSRNTGTLKSCVFEQLTGFMLIKAGQGQ